MSLEIVCVVVTFNPQLERLHGLIEELGSQVARIVVVDNNSAPDIQESIKSWSHAALHVLTLSDNLGIAAAQNQGIAVALQHRCDAVVFFDQDSQVGSCFISALAEPFRDPSIGISAPVLIDEHQGFEYPIVNISSSGRRQKFRPGESGCAIDVSVVISSGTMVKREVLEAAGGMDSRLFIDYVDTEWCLRCARLGWLVRISPQAQMLHSIGEQVLKIGRFRVPIHTPERRYYRIRNAFLLLRYTHVPTLMCIQEIVVGFAHQLVHVLLTKHKQAHVRFYLQAVWDGIRGAAGPYRSRDRHD